MAATPSSAIGTAGHPGEAAMAARHRRVGLVCASVAVGMVGAAYAAVPLYRLFCQATGFGGTTMVAAAPSTTVLDRTVNVGFDANTRAGLKWTFEPVQRSVDVKLGENALVFYRATNNSDRPLTGTALFNVSPEQAGQYFNKIECFCFKEQTLQPGESVEMPVSFFVDAAYDHDRDIGHMGQITLSYSFFPVAAAPVAGVAQNAPPGQPAAAGKGG